MRAQVLEIPPVVTDRERADEWADQLEDLLLEVGEIFPRADLRRRASGCALALAATTGTWARLTNMPPAELIPTVIR